MARSKSGIVEFWIICLGLSLGNLTTACAQGENWVRYAIDDSLRGADGVKLADANGDGRLDIVTGWEESGQARAYFHPGPENVYQAWPRVAVGKSPATEDALWFDGNGDGQLDVLSSCEGSEQSLRLHIAPQSREHLLDETAWSTEVIPCSQGVTRWMFAVPFPTASPEGHLRISDVIVGSKSPNGMVGILRTGSGDLKTWSIDKLVDADWIMSLEPVDMDADGDFDILYTDRKGDTSGVYWLENPGSSSSSDKRTDWKKHLIGIYGQEVMFLSLGSTGHFAEGAAKMLDAFYVAVKPDRIYRVSRAVEAEQLDAPTDWIEERIGLEQTERIGTSKGVAFGDLNGDGTDELVLSCESANGSKSGVVYFQRDTGSGRWKMHDVSGPQGIKFDLVELIDLDFDGDLDILTCEEREQGRGLGVIWYANPHRQ